MLIQHAVSTELHSYSRAIRLFKFRKKIVVKILKELKIHFVGFLETILRLLRWFLKAQRLKALTAKERLFLIHTNEHPKREK